MSRSRRSSRRSPTMSWRHLVEAAAEAGARGALLLPVRLPHEVAPLFRAWLDEHYPDRAAKVMATIQSIRGGRDNDPNFFTRMRGQGPWAELLRTRFEIACRKHGLPQIEDPAAPRPVRAAAGRPAAAVLIDAVRELMADFRRTAVTMLHDAASHLPMVRTLRRRRAARRRLPPRRPDPCCRRRSTPRSPRCATRRWTATNMPGTSSRA